MKLNCLLPIFVLIALFAINCSAQAPPFCNSNVASLCSGAGPRVRARAGRGQCQTYANKCLIQQLNCIRYRNREPLLTVC